jgi:hypothetical protein
MMESHAMVVPGADRPNIVRVLWATLHSSALSWGRYVHHILFKLVIAGSMDLNNVEIWHL